MSAAAELAESLRGPSALDLPHGIHYGVPEEQYHRRVLGLASKHALDLVAKAPAAYRAWVDGADDEPSTAMQFGKDFHTACLEPALYKPGKLTTAKGRDDAERIAGMVRAVMAHPVAGPLVRHGKPEVTARWKDPGTGIECKARADLYAPGLRTIVDLKSCADASPEEFAKSVARFTYHWQAAMYLDGFSRAGADVDTFAFIAVEKSAPYLVAVYTLDEGALVIGGRRIARSLDTLSRCIASGDWPGISDRITTLSLPRWAED